MNAEKEWVLHWAFPWPGVSFLIWWFTRSREGTPMEVFLGFIVAIATVVGVVAGIIQQRQSNRHFAEQNRIMIEQAEGKIPQRLPVSLNRPSRWPMVAMILMVLLTWVAVGYDTYDRRAEGNWGEPKERVVNQTFSNTTVALDNRHFINPVFDHVTFEYDGTGPVQIDNAKIIWEQVHIASNNHGISQALSIQNAFMKMIGCPIQGQMEEPPTSVPAVPK
jgi:cytochrome b